MLRIAPASGLSGRTLDRRLARRGAHLAGEDPPRFRVPLVPLVPLVPFAAPAASAMACVDCVNFTPAAGRVTGDRRGIFFSLIGKPDFPNLPPRAGFGR